MNYTEAIQFLSGLQVFGAHLGLETPRRLAARTGNPQDQLRFIHVAGTNGKGSTCAMLESIYRAAGRRVGLFTSPHLVSFRERIQVNRQWLPEADAARLVTELAAPSQAEDSHSQAGPTFFEFVTVMALRYFAEQRCDLVIWETGLGGRLDATNIVTPLASVITNIAFDHQQWLGDTLAKIAAEKAGIIKPGVPVVTATAAPEALRVIEQTAKERNAPLQIVTAADAHFDFALPLLGEHQKLNAALARAVVETLQAGLPVSAAQIQAGLRDTRWVGRLQQIQTPDGRRFLLDGAHNPAGAEALRAALERHFAGVPFTLIFGALADKEWPVMGRILAPLAARIIAVPVASERTAAAGDLADALRAAHPAAATVAPAADLAAALDACKNEAFVVITGSLYLIGEALALLESGGASTAERSLNEWIPAGKGGRK